MVGVENDLAMENNSNGGRGEISASQNENLFNINNNNDSTANYAQKQTDISLLKSKLNSESDLYANAIVNRENVNKRPQALTHDSCFVSEYKRPKSEVESTVSPISNSQILDNNSMLALKEQLEKFQEAQMKFCCDSDDRKSFVLSMKAFLQKFPHFLDVDLRVTRNPVDLFKLNIEADSFSHQDWLELASNFGFLPSKTNANSLKKIHKSLIIPYQKFNSESKSNGTAIDNLTENNFEKINEIGIDATKYNLLDDLISINENTVLASEMAIKKNTFQAMCSSTKTEDNATNVLTKCLYSEICQRTFQKHLNSQSISEIFLSIDFISKMTLEDEIFPQIFGSSDCKPILSTLIEIMNLSLMSFFSKAFGTRKSPKKCKKCEAEKIPSSPPNLEKIDQFLNLYCHECLQRKYKFAYLNLSEEHYLRIAFSISSLLRNLSFDFKHITAMATSLPILLFCSIFVSIDSNFWPSMDCLNSNHLLYHIITKMEDDALVILSNIAIDIPLKKLKYKCASKIVRSIVITFNKSYSIHTAVKAYLSIKILAMLAGNSRESAGAIIQLAGNELPQLIEHFHAAIQLYYPLQLVELIMNLLFLLIRSEPEYITLLMLRKSGKTCMLNSLAKFIFGMNTSWVTFYATTQQSNNANNQPTQQNNNQINQNRNRNQITTRSHAQHNQNRSQSLLNNKQQQQQALKYSTAMVPSYSLMEKCIACMEIFIDQCCRLARKGSAHELETLFTISTENMFLLSTSLSLVKVSSAFKLSKICLVLTNSIDLLKTKAHEAENDGDS